MSHSSRWIHLPALAGVLLACLHLTGCASRTATPPPGSVQFNYQTTPSPLNLPVSARVEATVTFAPDVRTIWRGWRTSDQLIDTLQQVAAAALKDDVAKSGLFARILEPGQGKPDYLVKIQAEEYNMSDLRLRMTIRLFAAATGAELFARNAEVPLGLSCGGPGKRYALTTLHPPSFPPNLPGSAYSGPHLMIGSLQVAAQQMMPVMKAGVGQFLQTAQEKAAASRMETAALPELIVAADASAYLARARNRAIIAAKNQQLPAMLREMKTDGLATLVVKLEQTILDLSHESELAKDRAQQATAAGGDAVRIDEIRGLSLSYRERIELLKPILSALKEEIANRNR